MLHILSHSPWRCDILALLRMLHIDDDLLLIQDGVFAAIRNSRFIKMFYSTQIIVSALKEDVSARGLIDQISDKINVINYTDFIDLIIKQPSHMSW